MSRHRHSPSIALTEEDPTEGKLPIKESIVLQNRPITKIEGNTPSWDKKLDGGRGRFCENFLMRKEKKKKTSKTNAEECVLL